MKAIIICKECKTKMCSKKTQIGHYLHICPNPRCERRVVEHQPLTIEK